MKFLRYTSIPLFIISLSVIPCLKGMEWDRENPKRRKIEENKTSDNINTHIAEKPSLEFFDGAQLPGNKDNTLKDIAAFHVKNILAEQLTDGDLEGIELLPTDIKRSISLVDHNFPNNTLIIPKIETTLQYEPTNNKQLLSLIKPIFQSKTYCAFFVYYDAFTNKKETFMYKQQSPKEVKIKDNLAVIVNETDSALYFVDWTNKKIHSDFYINLKRYSDLKILCVPGLEEHIFVMLKLCDTRYPLIRIFEYDFINQKLIKTCNILMKGELRAFYSAFEDLDLINLDDTKLEIIARQPDFLNFATKKLPLSILLNNDSPLYQSLYRILLRILEIQEKQGDEAAQEKLNILLAKPTLDNISKMIRPYLKEHGLDGIKKMLGK